MYSTYEHDKWMFQRNIYIPRNRLSKNWGFHNIAYSLRTTYWVCLSQLGTCNTQSTVTLSYVRNAWLLNPPDTYICQDTSLRLAVLPRSPLRVIPCFAPLWWHEGTHPPEFCLFKKFTPVVTCSLQLFTASMYNIFKCHTCYLLNPT